MHPGTRSKSCDFYQCSSTKNTIQFWSIKALKPSGSLGLFRESVIWNPGFNPPHLLLPIKGTNPKRGGVLVKVTQLTSQNSPSYEFSSEERSKSLRQSYSNRLIRHITNRKSQMMALERIILHRVLFWGFLDLDILGPFSFHFGFL